MTTRKPTGYLLYSGPSQLDGAPIAAVAIVRSTNTKTGNMVQTYIIRSDVHPVTAARTGADESVCGDCKHRPLNGNTCYVTLFQGPASVYRALQRGIYPRADAQQAADLGAGRMVRLGTYGDPAAVPAHVWEALTSRAAGRTGYTHQWENPELGYEQQAALRSLVMASADSIDEYAAARLQGWRTFRVMAPADRENLPGEFECPASAEQGKRKTCATCGACDGAERGAGKASVAIVVHGSKARRFIPIAVAA